MYNKYLIEMYTGILHNYNKALAIAERELENRFTPQTNAWYVWCLYLAGQKEKAENVYKKHVSNKPLEALDLYWIGKYIESK
jgi:tetratricopeptide (TPR) repeat protein